ncbi:MAG: glycosyltransferase family 9 protein [Desulfobacterales bacterium]|nr:glycosyltransferase family 9 protein [Desulfobacterales bacterium]
MKAIAYFSNGLGNYILQMSAMAAVASMTDSKTIDICLDDNWRDPRRPAIDDICRAWPIIDKVISWPKDQLNGNYDLWFYSAHGTSCDVVQKFLHNMKHHPVPKPSWKSSLIHEEDHYMEIAYAIGYQGPIPKVEFPLAEDPILNLQRPIIGICNGWFRTEKMYWQKKGWPYFKKLAETMRHYFGASIVGIGKDGEIPSEVILDANFGGKLSILQSAKVISQLDLVITTDTGPMHLTNILDIPLIALFGPTLTSKNGPRGKNSSALISGMDCAPCQDTSRFYNCQRSACMEGITIGDIMAKAREKLK